MFGILYKCNDGRDYYCTSSRFAHFSEDIESIAEFAQQKTAEKIANHFTKTNDFEELYGTGKLLVIKVVKVPLSLKENLDTEFIQKKMMNIIVVIKIQKVSII